jgi:dynein axonemal heavy chain
MSYDRKLPDRKRSGVGMSEAWHSYSGAPKPANTAVSPVGSPTRRSPVLSPATGFSKRDGLFSFDEQNFAQPHPPTLSSSQTSASPRRTGRTATKLQSSKRPIAADDPDISTAAAAAAAADVSAGAIKCEQQSQQMQQSQSVANKTTTSWIPSSHNNPTTNSSLHQQLRNPLLRKVWSNESSSAAATTTTAAAAAAATAAATIAADSADSAALKSSTVDIEANTDKSILTRVYTDTESQELESQLQLKTGEDAITFFARHGSSTPMKFVYCNRRSNDGEYAAEFRPYDLVVVDRKDVDAEFFTISASGVVHVTPNQPSEFVSLSDWMHQSSTFKVMRAIPFFNHFLVVKAFRSWRANVRYSLYCQKRAKLSKTLFRSHPSFNEPLLEASRIVQQMNEVSLLSNQPQKIYRIEEFATEQAEQRMQGTKKFEEYVEKLEMIVEKTCREVSERAQMYAEQLRQDANSTGFIRTLAHHAQAKSKSMVAQKKERAEQLRRLRHAEAEVAMLPSFIQLVDYMQIEGLVHVCRNMASSMLQMLQSRRHALLRTAVLFGPDGIEFTPLREEFEGAVQKVIDDTVAAVAAIDRIPNSASLKPFTESKVARWRSNTRQNAVEPAYRQQVDDVLRNSHSYQRTVQAVIECLDRDFSEAGATVAPLNRFCTIHEFGVHWDAEEYRAQRLTVDELQADMAEKEQWWSDVERNMRYSYDAGIFQVESRELKECLLPIAKDALEVMKSMLLDLFREQCQKLHVGYEGQIKQLDDEPTNLNSYALYVEKCNEIRENASEFDQQRAVVEMMWKLLGKYNIKIPAADSVLLDDARTAAKKFADSIETSEHSIMEKSSSMQQGVYQNIARLTKDFETQQGVLCRDTIVSDMVEPAVALEALSKCADVLNDLRKQAVTLQGYQVLFNMQPYPFQELLDTESLFEKRRKFWQCYREWLDTTQEWETADFTLLDVEDMNHRVGRFFKTVHQMFKEARAEVAEHLKVAADSPAVDDEPLVRATSKVRSYVLDWKQAMPVILELGNQAMQESHWSKLITELGHAFHPSETIKLARLRDMGVFDCRELVSEVCEQAIAEHALEVSLRKVESAWARQEFIIVPYVHSGSQPKSEKSDEAKNSTDAASPSPSSSPAEDSSVATPFVLGDVEDVTTLLEDNQVSLQTMLASRYIAVVQTRVERWDQKLSYLSDMLDEWLLCQRNWMYLEPIFSAVDIQRQLPAESTMFAEVDAFWRTTMQRIHEKPSVLSVLASANILEQFLHANEQLDRIQKQLEEYLETKRARFARFYFLSNDELLQILSQTRDPKAVQPHLRKIFDNMAKLQFETFQTDATDTDVSGSGNESTERIRAVGMISGENEVVPFTSPVIAHGPTEDWLNAVESEMRRTVRHKLFQALVSYPTGGADRSDWMRSQPAQAALAVDQIMWTYDLGKALNAVDSGENKQAVQQFLETSKSQISAMVELIRQDLTKLERATLACLIILDVHGRDVVNEMIEHETSSRSEYMWTKQLRYYWEVDGDDALEAAARANLTAADFGSSSDARNAIGDCMVRQTNAHFRYGYEYLGNTPRLVITPLTDKAYLTLTGALHLHYGGAPAGPAGTGKTETVKDLAKALAVQIVVFNCSDGLDTAMMGRFFSGLAQAGAWACFDEFNRIDIEVLSVIAQQILTIQQAISMKKEQFKFEGRMIPLNTNFGVFITMNPGYAGRTELPDNLKALFRPVAMMIPDYALIAQIILFSEGFQTATVLSKKMVQLYKLSSEQLSKQDHYDFGMRAVKSVLVMAGSLKRKYPDTREDVLLIRAMRDSNVPKFLECDLPLFRGIVSDLFPDVDIPVSDYGELRGTIESELRSSKLQDVPAFVEKILQLHETMIVRHGVMLVGSTASGKSTCAEILARSLSTLAKDEEAAVRNKDPFIQRVSRYILNPKAITMGELYGYVNPVTLEWADGLVASLVREASAPDTPATGGIALGDAKHHHHAGPSRKWITFDGPVDALWIENMNTVLDDNKVLCLANGERIKLPASLTMLFEVEDLATASPATVSRCGMVYLEPLHLGWKPLVDTWLEKTDLESRGISAALKKSIGDALYSHIGPVLKFVRSQQCQEHMVSADANLVTSCLQLLDVFLRPERGVDASCMSESQISRVVHMYAFLSFVWSFGANLADHCRPAFSTFLLHKLSKDVLPGCFDEAEAVSGISSIADVYEVCVQPQRAKFSTWSDTVPAFQYNPHVPYFSILVPTADTVRYRFLLQSILNGGYNVLFSGDTGVGKSVLVQDFFASQDVIAPSGDSDSGTATGAGADADAEDANATASDEKGVSLPAGSGNMRRSPSQESVAMGVTKSTTASGSDNSEGSRYIFVPVTFSAQTTSQNLQDVLETKLEKKRKNLYGAPFGKRVVVFVDDLNMPQCEVYGAQPPLELLRQCIDQGGFYDRKKLFFKNLANVQFVGACAPPGGGRNPVSARLLRHFHMMWMPQLNAASLQHIFGNILGGFLRHMRTGDSVDATPLVHSTQAIVHGSIEMYHELSAQMLPTPNKSHYTFNMRDLSKVFQGILQVEADVLPDVPSLVRLWTHETARVFRDRLVDDTDRKWFDDRCIDIIQTQFSKIDEMESELSNNVEQWNDTSALRSLVFGDFVGTGDRLYQRVTLEPTRLIRLLQDYLSEYNLTFSNQMPLVFFDDAVQHLARLCRILRQPRGNALLVGVGGSGRQSLTRMAAFMSGYECISIEITRGFGQNEWQESLRNLLFTAGAENKPVVFLVSDHHIVHESFLEDINNLLNSGEVPNLFEADHIEAIVNKVRPLARAAGRVETRDNILAHFVHLVRENLHVVLAFSPVGDAFRTRCRQYPALVNCCTIDWYDPWPEDALQSVARRFLSEMSLITEPTMSDGSDNEHRATAMSLDSPDGDESKHNELVDSLCKMCVTIHTSVSKASKDFFRQYERHNYTTPTSYLELLKLFSTMLDQMRDKVTVKLERYSVGLKKLQDTKEQVAELRKELIALQPVLEKSVRETAELLTELEQDQKEAKEKEELCAQDALACSETTAQVQKFKDECQRDLDVALPAFEAAIKALDTLKKDDITVIKSFSHPPAAVVRVMEAVCLLMGKKPNWDEAKKLLGSVKFLEMCKTYDKDNIPGRVIKKLQKYVQDADFVPEKMASASTAAVSLCMWVRAMDTYARIAKTVEPKRQALGEAEAKLHESEETLRTKQMDLREIQARIEALQAKYQAKLAERDELQFKEVQTKARLERAEKLVTGLGSEETRWADTAKQLENDMHHLVGNTMLSAGFVAYLGPFTSDFRQKLVSKWTKRCIELKVPVDPDFSLIRTLSDPVQVREWTLMGLPADPTSVENALIVTTGRRWPLMIDPQGQANRWVKSMGRQGAFTSTSADASKKADAHSSNPGGLQVIKLSQQNYLRNVENAIRFGQCLLLENVEEQLDAALEPVLLKQIFKKGGQWMLRLGDQNVPYSNEFRFFVTSKMANPHYLPETFVKVTVINFTVTPKGLEDQLLEIVCGKERPDLEAKNDRLIMQLSRDRRELDQIEATILRMLSDSKGNILDDQDLIEALGVSQHTSQAIKQRMSEAEITVAEINGLREKYRVVAERASSLYFVVANLAKLDPMYQYSLLYFSKLYERRIELSDKSDNLNERLQLLLDDITTNVYRNICRGLFEKDKLAFAFQMAIETARSRHSAHLRKAAREKLAAPSDSKEEEHVDILTFNDSAGISPKQWQLFLEGVDAVDTTHKKPQNPASEWLGDMKWSQLFTLTHAGALPKEFCVGADDSFAKHAEDWKAYAASDNPVSHGVPAPWIDELSPFQQLLVLKALREDKVTMGMRAFVTAELGAEFAESPALSLASVYEDSLPSTPIVLVLSPGADPMSALLKLAREREMEDGRFQYISLGQGQGPIAEQLMEQGRRNGDWICLQNCHLAVSWLSRLEHILEQTNAPGTESHPDFRLWLTSMPSNKFPVPILQNSIKVTNEPPKGIRANLFRTFADIDEEEFEACPSREQAYKKLLYGLGFFHAAIQERRKFGSIGWNIPYAWMDSDLQVSKQQLRMYLSSLADDDEIPWETLHEVIGEVNYAGRVTDDKDQRCVRSMLDEYFGPQVLADNHEFVAGCSTYTMPSSNSLTEVRQHISSMPVDDDPVIFGLHSNADVVFQLQATAAMIHSLKTMRAGVVDTSALETETDSAVTAVAAAAAAADTKVETEALSPAAIADQKVFALARAIAEELPDPMIEAKEAHPDTFANIESGSNTLGVFLRQEISRFNSLLAKMHSSLDALQRGIKGLVVMSADLETMYLCFLDNQVPPSWEKAAYPSLKPLRSWIEDLKFRVNTLRSWLRNGEPTAFWMSGFFFPQGFLTSVLQRYARSTKIPIDDLAFRSHVMDFNLDHTDMIQNSTDDEDSNAGDAAVTVTVTRSDKALQAPACGVYVYGLYAQGASWDSTNGILAESRPGELSERMPVIWLEPVRISTQEDSKISTYLCPVYKTSARAGELSTTGHSTNFVTYLQLPTEADADHWVRRGVALLSQLDS